MLGMLAAGAAAFAGNISIDDIMQNWLPAYASANRATQASQHFSRRYTEIDMRLAKQGLHREDLRDLVDLTTSRMDIYHVVGTLLLTFCITWFTDASILEKNLPWWFLTLFLISNFTAVGFLVLSVWLAMHASIASKSVGVRLLTNFARMTIPTKEELKELNISVIPSLGQFLTLGRKAGEKAGAALATAGAPESGAASTGQGPAPPQTPSSKDRGGGLRRRRLSRMAQAEMMAAARQIREEAEQEADPAAEPAAAAPASASGLAESRQGRFQPERHGTGEAHEQDGGQAADGRGAAEGSGGGEEDDQHHFRRFLQEQMHWLSYDAYARVCMSLGMNQMLQALAYYIVGNIWQNSAAAGLCCFVAVILLSVLLLKLDIADGSAGGTSSAEILGVFFLMVGPSLFAATVIWLLEPLGDENKGRRILATPCYILHAGWLFFVMSKLQPGFWRLSSFRESILPQRIRTVSYLNVIHMDQRRMAQEARTREALGLLGPLRSAREQLQRLIKEAQDAEAESGEVSLTRRRCDELGKAQSHLVAELDRVQTSSAGCSCPETASEIQLARQALERFEVWDKAPELFATLEALRDQSVQGWLEEDDRYDIEKSYQTFLQHCLDLDLGITMPGSKEGAPLKALQVAPEDAPMVRIDAPETVSGALPLSVWIDPWEDECKQDHQPMLKKRTSVRTTLRTSLPAFTAQAKEIRNAAEASERGGGSRSTTAASSFTRTAASSFTRTAAPESEAGGDLAPIMPKDAIPPDMLPARLVRKFTMGTALWWLAAACIHIGEVIANKHAGPLHAVLDLAVDLEPVAAEWPEPAPLFEVTSLKCSGLSVFVTDHFSLYAALWRGGAELGSLAHLGDATDAAALLCNAQGCDGLSEPVEGGDMRSRLLAPLRPPWGSSRTSAAAPLPRTWRGVSAVWARPCAAQGACNLAHVVGWDGTSVNVGTLQLDAVAGTWRLHQRFKVRPGLGRCASPGAAACPPMGPAGYANVSALHLGAEGRTLTVLLHGGLLDGWDLTTGSFLGRWQLGGDYRAMCHNGEKLLLARQGGSGPVLVSAPLPAGLVEAERGTEGRDAGARTVLSAEGESSAVPRGEQLAELEV